MFTRRSPKWYRQFNCDSFTPARNGSVFIPASAPSLRTNPIPTGYVPSNYLNTCADCGLPAKDHTNPFLTGCFNSPDAIASGIDSMYEHSDISNSYTTLDRYGLPFISDLTSDNPSVEDQYEADPLLTADWCDFDYRDLDPTECTSLLGEPTKPLTHTRETSARVEGSEGYITTQELDLNVTNLVHARFLNVFREGSNTGGFRIGGVRITTDPNGTVHAHCVWSMCNYHSHINLNLTEQKFPDVPIREFMMDFALSAIVHGNNHSAKSHFEQTWDRQPLSTDPATYNRRWYPLHRPGCNKTHNVRSTRQDQWQCNTTVSTKPLADLLTEGETYLFLQEHARWCSDDKCAHEFWLTSVMPRTSDRQLNKLLTSLSA